MIGGKKENKSKALSMWRDIHPTMQVPLSRADTTDMLLFRYYLGLSFF
jgi:hypothetical protein